MIKQDASKMLGRNLRKYRKQRGMTQEQVVAKMQLMGCSILRGAYAKIEVGIRNVSVLELNVLKRVLQVSYDQLLEEKED